MNVLIIEDEARAANRLKKLLFAIDASIHVKQAVESVREAVEFLKQEQVDLIFQTLNWRMD